MNQLSPFEVITVTLNPAIDRTLTIPKFTSGEVNRVEQERANPGGKGVNVACALADYGHRVAVTGFLGRENSGSFEALFEEKNIADQMVRVAGQTRVGIKITDPVRQQTTDINFPGLSPSLADIDLLRQQLATMQSPWFVIAGSLPPGVDATLYRDLITTIKQRGCKVVLDASGEALRYAIEAGPNIIKPNLHELETLVGHPLSSQAEVIEAAQALVASGIELVVISMGQEGACFATATEVVIACPPLIEVTSTVGAGDAMVAGIVAAQMRRLPLPECARLASTFSIDALLRIEPGITSAASIEAFMGQITLETPTW